MTKEEKIEEKWGAALWGIVKGFVDESGFVEWNRFNPIGTFKDSEVEYRGTLDTYRWRPKSLSGIETNNGWIKIESEADLPKDDNELFESGLLDESGYFHQERKRHSLKTLKWMFERKLVTHYHTVEKLLPPHF